MARALNQLEEIEQQIDDMYGRVLQPLDQWGLVTKKDRCRYPMVLFVGNYSSGKSSLINSIIGRSGEQEVGAAPTDAGFTLIMKETGGAKDSTIKGNTLLRDQSFGFSGLSEFGPCLEARLALKKVRTDSPLLPESVMLVDTPGLTDFGLSTPRNDSGDERDLFPQKTHHEVIRWFAERSSLIFFLFDPEKPGGVEQSELLTLLLRCGVEGKISYVFNKVDKLPTVQDFVLTFGTLCWTLSKYFPRKDPPTFYTTYTPLAKHPGSGSSRLSSRSPQNTSPPLSVNGSPERDNSLPAGSSMEAALMECDARRDDLLRKIGQVPYERADNLIKQAEEAVDAVSMASRVCNELLRRGQKRVRRCAVAMVGLTLALVCMLHQLNLVLEADDPFSMFSLYATLLVASVAALSGYLTRLHLHGYYEYLVDPALDWCFIHVFSVRPHKPVPPSMTSPRALDMASLGVAPNIEASWHRVKSMMKLNPVDHAIFARIKRVPPAKLQLLDDTKRGLEQLHAKAAVYRAAMSARQSQTG